MPIDPLDFQRLIPVRDRFQDDLLAIPGVTGVGVGLKEIGGEQQPTPAILVFVKRKGQYRPGDEIPRTVGDVPTDVIEADFKLRERASGVASAPPAPMIDKTRYNPCQGGACIAPARFTTWYGSLGLLVTDTSSRAQLWLSAYHVLCVDASWEQKDKRVLQPSIDQGGVAGTDVIGNVVRGVYGAVQERGDTLYVDAAVCDVSGRSASADIVSLGRPKGAAAAVLNEDVDKYGATTLATRGKITDTDFTVQIDGVVFKHQYRVDGGTKAFSKGGDSGSAVLDPRLYAIGLVKAGDGVRFTTVNPIGQITRALKIDVPTTG
jgi:hypothetical protein